MTLTSSRIAIFCSKSFIFITESLFRFILKYSDDHVNGNGSGKCNSHGNGNDNGNGLRNSHCHGQGHGNGNGNSNVYCNGSFKKLLF